MKTYTISHPINGKMNHDCVDSVEYMDICDLSANSLEEAFKLAQNDFNEDYRQGNVRSTSVGDIIIDVEEDKSYLVKGTGFQEIKSKLDGVKLNREQDIAIFGSDIISEFFPVSINLN